MAGAYGNSSEDRYFQAQLTDHLREGDNYNRRCEELVDAIDNGYYDEEYYEWLFDTNDFHSKEDLFDKCEQGYRKDEFSDYLLSKL